jgi:hypothetical protein
MITRISALILIFSLLCLAGYGYEETFDKGPDGWEAVKGTKWELKDGAYRQSNLQPNQFSFYAVDDRDWEDYVFEVQINPVSGNNYAGVLWRVQAAGAGNTSWATGKFYYWLIGVENFGGSYSKIWEAPSGQAVDEKPGTERLVKGEWNDVRVEVKGNTFKMYLNGSLQKEYTDKDGLLEWGGVGLSTYEAEALFDNVKVAGKGIPGGLAVDSAGKLAVRWGALKRQ